MLMYFAEFVYLCFYTVPDQKHSAFNLRVHQELKELNSCLLKFT